jgi:hypothetical protein
MEVASGGEWPGDNHIKGIQNTVADAILNLE